MDLGDYFNSQFNNPTTELGSMYSYLKGQNRLPNIQSVSPDQMEPGDFGEYQGKTNILKIIPYPDSVQNTMVHELAHAAAHTMDRQAVGYGLNYKNITPEQTQYLEASSKFSQPTQVPFGMTGSKDLLDYRTNPGERIGFGMGNSVVPNQAILKSGPHYDSTAATEFQILLDLARRAQKSKPQPGYIDTLKNLFR